MITTADIEALIAFSILNNKQGVINAMNVTGNTVALNISDDELADKVWAVFSQKGLDGLRNVLSRVSVDRTKVTQDQARALLTKFRGVNPTTRWDWVNNVLNTVGDFLGGHSSTSVTPTTQQQTSSSVISPAILALIVVVGIIAIGIFRKFTAVVIAIVVIVAAVVAYGIFAKNVTTVVSGGGGTTQQHGGVGSVLMSWITGLG